MSQRKPDDLPVRRAARVLLLDDADRILLMNGRLPGAETGCWFTVGGGMEADESVEAAAAREILEETGIASFDLGPVVWVREGVLHMPHAVWHREWYLVARCAAVEPARHGWTEEERAQIDDIRWWTVGELQATTDRVFPPGLADRLPPVIAGRYPAVPETVPWDSD